MDDLGQDRAVWVYPVADDLVLDLVAASAAEVDEASVAFHRVDWDHEFVQLGSVPFDFHLLLRSCRWSLSHGSRVFCDKSDLLIFVS